MPKNSMPMAQMSWNPPRRSRHWSNRATLKTRARIAVRAGRQDLEAHRSATDAAGGSSMNRSSNRSSSADASSYEVGQSGRVQRSASAESERAPPGTAGARRRSEHDGLGQARSAAREPGGLIVDDAAQASASSLAGVRVVTRPRVEEGDERGDQPAPIASVGLSLIVDLGGAVACRARATVGRVAAGGRPGSIAPGDAPQSSRAAGRRRPPRSAASCSRAAPIEAAMAARRRP